MKDRNYDVAAYIWPAYCQNDRTDIFWPEGDGEWQSVRSAMAKYPGDSWPRRPLWGYVDEADPRVMEMQIDEATRHGVNVFIYDWYWYDRRPYLENCLNDGFLGAANRDKMRFYLMWANHDAVTVWDKRLSDKGETVIWQGAQDRTEFERIARRLTQRYFLPGCPACTCNVSCATPAPTTSPAWRAITSACSARSWRRWGSTASPIISTSTSWRSAITTA